MNRVFVIVFLFLLLLASCKSPNIETSNMNNNTKLEYEDKENEHKKEIENLSNRIKELEKENKNLLSQYKEMQKTLHEKTEQEPIDKKFKFEDVWISDIKISNDGKYIILLIYDSFEYTGTYLINVETHELTKLQTYDSLSADLSPDNNHFLVSGIGYPDVVYHLYSVDNKEKILSFSGATLFWINNNEVVYEKINKDIRLDNPNIELDGTVDIVKHNLFTGEMVKLKEGTSQYYYTINYDDKAKCYRHYVSSNEKGLEFEIVDIFE